MTLFPMEMAPLSIVAAAARLSKLDEGRFTHFAGAYLGFGFHEDGFRSAVNVAARLGVTF